MTPSIFALVYLGFTFMDMSHGSKYGPSLISLHSRILQLEDFPNYSVLIPLTRNKVTAYANELAEEGPRWKDSKTVIKAPGGFRVMIVIQVLHLGVGYDDKLETDLMAAGLSSCIDSMQILEYGELVGEICGSVNLTDRSSHPKDLVGSRVFLSQGNSVVVGLQFGKPLQEWQQLYSRYRKDIFNRRFSLEVAITAFKECKAKDQTGFRPCSPDLIPATQVHKHVCINAKLFCDGVLNCPANDAYDNIGIDEDLEDCSAFEYIPQELSHRVIPQIDHNPDDNYEYVYGQQSTMSPTQTMGNLRFAEAGLNPSTTVLLIVLPALAVMALGLIIRVCCTRCTGKFPPTPRLSTVSEASSSIGDVWTVSPVCSLRQHQYSSSVSRHISGLFETRQCSKYDSEKDLPPSYEDLFPQDASKNPAVQPDDAQSTPGIIAEETHHCDDRLEGQGASASEPHDECPPIEFSVIGDGGPSKPTEISTAIT